MSKLKSNFQKKIGLRARVNFFLRGKIHIVILVLIVTTIIGGIYFYSKKEVNNFLRNTLIQKKFEADVGTINDVNNAVYVTIYSHNEGGGYWETLINDESEYKKYRTNLIQRVKLIDKYGATLNWESDVSVLLAMQKYEQSGILQETNGKNILRWMVEDMGVVVDPHGHLEVYNYADLAYLIEQLGVKPSSVIGGFALYNCSEDGTFNQEDWIKQLEIDSSGKIKGRVYNYIWEPKILGQPAMVGHAFDEFSSGVWHPKTKDFLKNDLHKKFIYIGQGYPHYIENVGKWSSGGSTIWYEKGGYIKELISMIQKGDLPKNKIYTASIHVRDEPSSLAVASTNDSLQITLTALQPLAENKTIVYADYEKVGEIWKNNYNGISSRLDIDKFSVYNKLIAEVKTMCAEQNNTGTCGDKICDDLEKQNSICPEDCQSTSLSL